MEQEQEIRLGRSVGLWPVLLVLIGVIIGICIAQVVFGQMTDGQMVDQLTDLFQRRGRTICEHMIARSLQADALGDAYAMVVADLLGVRAVVDKIERRAALDEDDKAIILQADPAAVFDVKEIPEVKKIPTPTPVKESSPEEGEITP